LRGDVRLEIADPLEMNRRRYNDLRKLLGEYASNLEVPHEEVVEKFRQLDYEHVRLGRAGLLKDLDIKEAQREGTRIVEYRVLMQLEGSREEDDTGHILVVVRPLSLLGEFGDELFGKYALVDRDPIATINEYFPYPYNEFTLSHKGIDTAEIDQKMIPQLLDSLRSKFGVLGVNISATPAYRDVFARSGFMPFNPNYPNGIGYKILEEI